MAIKIGGTSIIDDNKNIANVGIVTVGIGGTSGIFKVGTGVTIDGAGNAYFDGFITVNGGINYLVGITSIYPQDNDLFDGHNASNWDGNLLLYFDSPVQASAGSTLTVELRKTSPGGVAIATAGVSSITTPGGDFSVLNIAFGDLPGQAYDTFFPVIPKGIIEFSLSGEQYRGNYSGDPQQNLYSFKWGMGIANGGGYLICQSGGTNWIVAPSSTEVSRSWYDRGAAVTTANACAACGDWFIPSCSQLQNPGFVCREYWDTYANNVYWSNPRVTYICAWAVNFSNGSTLLPNPTAINCVRSFRCVTY